MVFYFTGTGNSLHVARELDGNCISIPQALRGGDLRFSAERIGIVAPVYGHELPGMVADFIRRADLDTGYLYCIATYGSGHSGAGAWMEDLFARCGKRLDYANVVLMPDNYLPGFDMERERQREATLDIGGQVAAIRADIDARRRWILPAGPVERMVHRQAVAMKRRVVTDGFLRGLYSVADACTGCGVCSRVCPAGCFDVRGGRAVQDPSGCQMCMACVHACPAGAVRLNMPEPNPAARYRNSHVSLRDIMEANDQRGGA